jgi:hypothetical protein
MLQRKGARFRPMSQVIRFAESRPTPRHLFFSRAELNQLLSLYSRRVAAGEWRDYAIDHRPGIASFSVFRHSLDRPLYAVVKYMNRDKTVDYRVMTSGRRIKQSKDLADALGVIERQLRVVS